MNELHEHQYLDHPAFRDVFVEVVSIDYLPESNSWSIAARWWHRRGWMLAKAYRIELPDSKFKEFVPYNPY